MSKMDAMRALREARYGAAEPATGTRRSKPRPRVADRPEPVVAVPVGDEPCGHRAISGRTCTREKGHAAKSHRYS